MTRVRSILSVTGALPLLALTLTAAAPVDVGRAEVVVQNESFSSLAIAVVGADGADRVIGQAPPEFSNTLFFPTGAADERVRFRARLRDGRDVLHESEMVAVRDGTKLRWSLPDNVIQSLGRARSSLPR
jgi:hypothetical protein